jgi:hypothetical protein
MVISTSEFSGRRGIGPGVCARGGREPGVAGPQPGGTARGAHWLLLPPQARQG